MATASVETFLSTELEQLYIDSSYANFVAESIATDDGSSAEEKKATLHEMLVLALESAEPQPDDNEAAVERLLGLVDEAMQLFSVEDQKEKTRAAEEAADRQRKREASERAAAAAKAAAAATAAAPATISDVDAVDASMKRLIMANYGYEFEDDPEEAAEREKAAKRAAQKASKSSLGGGPTRLAGGGGLEDALGQLVEDERGPDTNGLGRRAKRRVEAGGPGAAAGSPSGNAVAVAGDVGIVGLAGAHAGTAAAFYGSADSAAAAASARAGMRDGVEGDLKEFVVTKSITGRKNKHAKGKGHGRDSDSDDSEVDSAAVAAPSRGLVFHDPMAVQLNNR